LLRRICGVSLAGCHSGKLTSVTTARRIAMETLCLPVSEFGLQLFKSQQLALDAVINAECRYPF
jgi:hypothetical protein